MHGFDATLVTVRYFTRPVVRAWDASTFNHHGVHRSKFAAPPRVHRALLAFFGTESGALPRVSRLLASLPCRLTSLVLRSHVRQALAGPAGSWRGRGGGVASLMAVPSGMPSDQKARETHCLATADCEPAAACTTDRCARKDHHRP